MALLHAIISKSGRSGAAQLETISDDNHNQEIALKTSRSSCSGEGFPRIKATRVAEINLPGGIERRSCLGDTRARWDHHNLRRWHVLGTKTATTIGVRAQNRKDRILKDGLLPSRGRGMLTVSIIVQETPRNRSRLLSRRAGFKLHHVWHPSYDNHSRGLFRAQVGTAFDSGMAKLVMSHPICRCSRISQSCLLLGSSEARACELPLEIRHGNAGEVGVVEKGCRAAHVVQSRISGVLRSE